MYDATRSSGCMHPRSNIQASRGFTHRMRSGSTPLSSSHVHVSMAVLPAPSTVKPAGWSARSTRPFGGTHRTPSSTRKLGVWRDGISDSTHVASTSLRARTVVTSPDSTDATTCPSESLRR